MGQHQRMRALSAIRAVRAAGLVLVSALLIFFLLSPAAAQETPTPDDVSAGEQETPVDTQEPPTGTTETIIRLEVDAPVDPVPKGEEFEVQVLIENVEHLSGFDFEIQYDPKRVEPVTEADREDGTPGANAVIEPADGTVAVRGEVGEFLTTSPRGENMVCNGPLVREEDNQGDTRSVSASCVTLGPPVCLGGPAGASGSGVLGRVTFKSKGGDMTVLRLARTNLALDDVAPPCDPQDLRVQSIQHRRGGDVTLQLSGGGGLPWVVIAPILVIVALAVVGGGLLGLTWYQKRSASSS